MSPTPQTPPTDRPLTAGDVPLLREGDVLRVVDHCHRGPEIGAEVTFHHATSCSVWLGRDEDSDNDGWAFNRFAFVSRPATSAASEGEGATPGPWSSFEVVKAMRGAGHTEFVGWEILGRDDGRVHSETDGVTAEGDIAFIAAANPAVVLAILSEIEGLKAERVDGERDAGREAIWKVVHEVWQLLDDAETDSAGITKPDQERWNAVSEAMDALEALVPDSAGPFWGGFPVNYFWGLK